MDQAQTPQSPSVTTTPRSQWPTPREVRHQVVQLDLMLEDLQRRQHGLSRAELVILMDQLELVVTRLSEVAARLENGRP